ncbi:tRNA/rRNA methyltransferase (SpoU) [Solidesulfovibrio fructosivorans JJ]]|uniref:Putative tRNA (cytidine(34)-2'-O)-methyltransferase n=1 Tax=Solidesulfovibrio fructosivorans JJ] TaxID=596151 RepID=E1JWH8_SOLFR|nr:tRNA (cytidine(34)-2'-O)-methyltransferase [Solidesulfovibrio fructosivorans]EFL51275.1 tRNA/rRNA methyltransferase (SpoU) [Solidesulfovibrio fructosivorans JJ]]
MIEVVLYEPEIPQNTGSVARLCAAAKTPLHLIKPLGFSLEDRYLKRAGLDYWPYVDLTVWDRFDDYLAARPRNRLVATTAGNRGHTAVPYHTLAYTPNDSLIFGTESRGLPESLLDAASIRLRIPIWGHVRSLNLANAASIVLYEALRSVGELDGK